MYILSSLLNIYISTITCRAFNEILKTDRTTFGADDDYVIGDVIPDELQQRVDAVVAGTAYEEQLSYRPDIYNKLILDYMYIKGFIDYRRAHC